MTTDILCVAAGLGATHAATYSSTRYYEAQSVSDAIEIARRNQYRYVLLDADTDTRAELDAKNVDYIIILADQGAGKDWVSRWLKAGSSAKTIKTRVARWNEKQRVNNFNAPIAYLSPDQWLGEMLAQTEPDKTDKEDV